MASFKDNSDAMWDLSLDAPTIKRVRERLALDLADTSLQSLERLGNDPVLLVDTLWVLCESQAQRREVSAADFGRSLVGDAIERATLALTEAILDFFPSRHRSVVAAARQKGQTIRDRALEIALAKIEDPALTTQVLAAMTAQMDQEVAGLLTRLTDATSSPASAASTPPA